jgi:AcrR family transcriptional regulator
MEAQVYSVHMADPREKILACACELYLEDGLEGFSMRKLAGRLGVTAPALYRHFDSKEQVLLEVVREAYDRFARHLYTALQGRTPLERFELAGDGYLEFSLENPRLFEVLFAAPDHLGWESLPADLESQSCALGQFWNDRVRECMDAGILRRGDPQAIALTMWGHAHGLVTLFLRGRLRMGAEEFRELYRSSHRRMLVGVATPEYGATLPEESRHLDGTHEGNDPPTQLYRTGT